MSDVDRKPGEKGPRPQRDVPEGFTLALALVDAVPVALFCASACRAWRRFRHKTSTIKREGHA